MSDIVIMMMMMMIMESIVLVNKSSSAEVSTHSSEVVCRRSSRFSADWSVHPIYCFFLNSI